MEGVPLRGNVELRRITVLLRIAEVTVPPVTYPISTLISDVQELLSLVTDPLCRLCNKVGHRWVGFFPFVQPAD